MRLPFVLVSVMCALMCAGCSVAPIAKVPASLAGGKQLGHAQGGQSPVSGATIQLWQVNTTTDGGQGTAMLLGTVTSSDGSGNATNANANAGNVFNTLPVGYFTITNAYSCPAGDALVYITASGGNPGLSAGTNNLQSQMVTALGSCNHLKSSVQTISISELTTVATVASLYGFMSSSKAIGASAAHTADLAAAFALMNEYVDFQAGTAPGPALPAGYSASTGDLNLLANVLANCVNSTGGTIGDHSPCGNLFSYSSASSNASTDITAAALYIRKFGNNISSIASLPAPQAPFQPADTTAPPDWTLPIFELPSTPTFSLSPGTYAGTQQVRLLDADPTAAIYFTVNGVSPTMNSQQYEGVITIGQSETIEAVAVASRRATSSIASATYTLTGIPTNAPTVLVALPTLPAGSTAAVTATAISSVDGSIVTFATAGGVGGSFSPATCTVSGGSCAVAYTPTGTAPAGTYLNDLTASFTAAGGDTAATALATIYVVPASTLTTLANGDYLTSSLIQASDGNFYGVDLIFSPAGRIFRMDSTGNVTTVYAFTGGSDGAEPEDHLVQGTDGAFYGVTQLGGSSNNGTLFKVDSAGNFTLLYSFSGSLDGAKPQRALVQGTDGSFYGTAYGGGASGYGTVYKVDASGNFTLLHAFADGMEGGFPRGSLLQGADGNFYGTTQGGGTYSIGTVYKMDTAGNVTTLYSFTGGADGAQPFAGLVQGLDGSFYGTTFYGGTYTGGTLYKVDASGNFTALLSLTGFESSRPESVPVQAADGDFYGLDSLAGSLFRFDSSGNFTLLHYFTGGADGSGPGGSLVQGADGSFYGTTAGGGSGAYSPGTLFKLTTSPALAGPVTLSVPAAVTHASGFTLTYSVVNASSATLQHCFATNSAGDVQGWTGIKTASTSPTNATLTAPSNAGSYTYTLTCGGVESGFATLNVN